MSESLELLLVTIGEEATARLIARYGGQRIYLPRQADPQHPIARVIGPAPFRDLLKRYGSGALQVPTAFHQQLHQRQLPQQNLKYWWKARLLRYKNTRLP